MGLLDKLFKPKNVKNEEKKETNTIKVKTDDEIKEEVLKKEILKKEEYEKFKNKKVKILKEDNSEIEVKQFCRKTDKKHVLLSDTDGDKKIFHIYYDCYEDWSYEYSKEFIGWKEVEYSSLSDDYNMCARCQERLFRQQNPSATITGYDFDYYFEKYNDNNDYNFIDYFDDDKDIMFKVSNEYDTLEIYKKHMILDKGNSKVYISYDINNLDEYFNIKSIELKPTLNENTRELAVYYLPVIEHPRKQELMYFFIKQEDIDECTKIIEYINNIIKEKEEIVKEEKIKRKKAQRE